MIVAELKLSQAQRKKLCNGEKIRLNPKKQKMEGKGLYVLVEPEKYNVLTKAFDTNRGLMFQLNSKELEVNSNPEMIDDQEVKDVLMNGEGFFEDIQRKAKKLGKTIKKTVKKVGKDIKKVSKKVLGKKATRALLDIGYEIKDLAEDVGEDLVEDIKKQGDEVFGDFIREFKNMSKTAKQTLKKLGKAGKIVANNITPDKWGRLVKKLPRFYRAELRNTPFGSMMREALRQGSKKLIESAIKTMYSNPYTAALAPATEVAYQAYGSKAIEELVDVSGLGLEVEDKKNKTDKKIKSNDNVKPMKAKRPRSAKQLANDERLRKQGGIMKKKGSGVKAGGDGLKSVEKIKECVKMTEHPHKECVGEGISASGSGLTASGSGVRAGGDGLSASGNGVSAGGGVKLQTRAPIPNFLLKKQLNLPVNVKEGSGMFAGSGHENVTYGTGGGAEILGMEKPVKAGVMKPRKIFATTLVNKGS